MEEMKENFTSSNSRSQDWDCSKALEACDMLPVLKEFRK